MASVEEELKKINRRINELDNQQISLMHSKNIDQTKVSKIAEEIQRLTIAKRELLQRLQLPAATNVGGGGAPKPAAGWSIVRYILFGILGLVLAVAIIQFFFPVIGVVEALPQLAPARETFRDSVAQVALGWCKTITYLFSFQLWTEPNALEQKYKLECLKQAIAAESDENYNHLIAITYNLEPSVEVGSKFFGEVLYEPENLRGTVKVKLNNVYAYFTLVGRSSPSPLVRGVYPPATATTDFENVESGQTKVLDIQVSGCEKDPCLFAQEQADESKKSTIVFDWLPGMEEQYCGESGSSNISSVRTTVRTTYDYKTPSIISNIIVATKKLAEPVPTKDLYGPVSAEVRGLSSNVAVVSGNDPQQNRMRVNIILKNNGEGNDIGDAKINKIELLVSHNPQIPHLEFVADECSVKPTVAESDSFSQRLVFDLKGRTIKGGGTEIATDFISCTVKYSGTVVGSSNVYTITPTVDYSYEILSTRTALASYEVCKAKFRGA